jgi:hypothetical protein
MKHRRLSIICVACNLFHRFVDKRFVRSFPAVAKIFTVVAKIFAVVAKYSRMKKE